MLKPEFITFTGLDETTDPATVMELSRRYPIEWGILFSENRAGHEPRYPRRSWVEWFLHQVRPAPDIRLSAHICGLRARQIVEKGGYLDPGLISTLTLNFRRIQLNIPEGHPADRRRAARFATMLGADRAILQCRGDFPDDVQVAWLYDRSGGKGEEPGSWDAKAKEEHYTVHGYAGGIGPDNVLEVLGKISAVHPPDLGFWIDMEGKIRTNDRLDLGKCEEVARAVYGDEK